VKTSWSIEYVERTQGGPAGAAQWRRDKCAELEVETGARWVCWQAHGKFVFAATWDGQEAATEYNACAAAILYSLERLTPALSFVELAGATGFSLEQVTSAALFLARNGWVRGTCGRMGGCCAIAWGRGVHVPNTPVDEFVQ